MKRAVSLPPRTRLGICCGEGCRQLGVVYKPLFKVQGLYRYRCSTCYEHETGHRHYEDRQERQL